uniref:hypothetical protein n=1 Tax=Serratia marcescens TaxID=615 RepID=UPI0015952C8D|nr:hypothetical protein [Serratia marcescens]
MDSEEPPNVRVACSGDIDEVVRLMHDAAAWMSAKGTPAWDVARIDRTFLFRKLRSVYPNKPVERNHHPDIKYLIRSCIPAKTVDPVHKIPLNFL